MAIRWSQAVTDALVTHLATTLHADADLDSTVCPVQSGWRDDGSGEPDSEMSVTVILSSRTTREGHAPASVSESATDGTVTTTYAVGDQSVNGQIDIVARYKSQLDDLATLVEAALVTLPFDGAVTLSLGADHYSQKARIRLTGTELQAGAGTLGGRWRVVLGIRCTGTAAAQSDAPEAVDLRQTTTGLGPDETTIYTP